MKVIAPQKDYEGSISGVVFVKGVAQVQDPVLADWLARRGYGIEAEEGDSAALQAIAEAPYAKAGEALDPDEADLALSTRVGRPIEDAAVTEGLGEDLRKQVSGEGVGALLGAEKSITSAPLIAPGAGSKSVGSMTEEEKAAVRKAKSERNPEVEVTAVGPEAVKEAQDEAAASEGSDDEGDGTSRPRARRRAVKGGGS